MIARPTTTVSTAAEGPAAPGPGLPGQRYVIYALQIAGLIAAVIYALSNLAAFLSRIQSFVFIAVAAIFLSYAVAPAVDRLGRTLPKRLAIAGVYVAMVATLVVAGIVILPSLAESAAHIRADIPDAVHAYHVEAGRLPLVDALPARLRNAVVNAPERGAATLADFGTGAATSLVAFGFSAASFVAFVIVVPVLSIYLLLEADTIRRAALRVTPSSARLPAARLVREIDTMLGSFIRGQLTVAAIVGVMMTLLLLLLHVKYALLIGVLAGLLDVVPYVGAVAGWLPAFGIALFTNGWQNAALVTLGTIAINQVEGNLIVPRIISAKVGLTPLTVIVALFVGGELAGVLGLLIAVPIVAMFRIVAERLVDETPSSPDIEAEDLRLKTTSEARTQGARSGEAAIRG